jgi:hypothetical protein
MEGQSVVEVLLLCYVGRLFGCTGRKIKLPRVSELDVRNEHSNY